MLCILATSCYRQVLGGAGVGVFETDRDKSEWVGSSLNGLDRLEWYKLVKRYGAHQYALGLGIGIG